MHKTALWPNMFDNILAQSCILFSFVNCLALQVDSRVVGARVWGYVIEARGGELDIDSFVVAFVGDEDAIVVSEEEERKGWEQEKWKDEEIKNLHLVAAFEHQYLFSLTTLTLDWQKNYFDIFLNIKN